MVEKLIIESCKNGERSAFKLCYEACAPYVFSIIRNYVSNKEDRKDLMQEVFVQIFHSMKKYDENKSGFKTWISRITINHTINFIKKNKKYSKVVPLDPNFDTVLDDDNFDFSHINSKILQQLIRQMPTGYKTVFLLSCKEGYSHDEISQILEISNQTSRSQLSRALKWLKNNYNKQTKKIKYG